MLAIVAIASVSTEASLDQESQEKTFDEPMSVLWQENNFSGQPVILKDFLDINFLTGHTNPRSSLLRLENGAEIVFYEDDY